MTCPHCADTSVVIRPSRFGAADTVWLCPHCADTGIVTRPYIAGIVSVMHLCACPAGRAVAREMEGANG